MEFKEIKGIGLFELLSKRGKEVFMPQGVFHWVNRAKKEANIDATIGVGRGLKSEISPQRNDWEYFYKTSDSINSSS